MELDVVRLAAEGLTNPEIAQRLFVSRSTVKAHLGRIFPKLGIRSRTELAAEAARRVVDGRRQFTASFPEHPNTPPSSRS